MNIEKVILDNLIVNEQFARKTIPFLKAEYFHDRNEKTIFELIESYIGEYNNLPSKVALQVELGQLGNITDDQFTDCSEILAAVPEAADPMSSLEWLVDTTEQFCQTKAIYNAIHASIKIMDDKEGKEQLSKGAIPDLLSAALGVSFDQSIGHDYLDDADARFDFYNRKEEKIPFDLDLFNKITGGGLARKTLNVLLAGTGVGKSMFMCHFAAHNLMQGKNVLYITMEMAEKRIGERIDANLLDVEIGDLKTMPRQAYKTKMDRLKMKAKGKLVIKEYPTSSAGAANFRHLLNELKVKKNFKPDIIYIDYLNICCSSRIKQSANVNSYTYIKSIAEELRGLAVESDVPIVSATQTTRSGSVNSDVDLTDTSESFGLPATVDFMVALIQTDQLKVMGQILIKQLKNRYEDLEKLKKFVVGVHRSKMRIFDAEDSAQNDLIMETPVFDQTPTGERYDRRAGELADDRPTNDSQYKTSMFDGFK